MTAQTISHPPVEGYHPPLLRDTCPCNPRRTTAFAPRFSGRGGRHQGHDRVIHVWHNAMDKPAVVAA